MKITDIYSNKELEIITKVLDLWLDHGVSFRDTELDEPAFIKFNSGETIFMGYEEGCITLNPRIRGEELKDMTDSINKKYGIKTREIKMFGKTTKVRVYPHIFIRINRESCAMYVSWYRSMDDIEEELLFTL